MTKTKALAVTKKIGAARTFDAYEMFSMRQSEVEAEAHGSPAHQHRASDGSRHQERRVSSVSRRRGVGVDTAPYGGRTQTARRAWVKEPAHPVVVLDDWSPAPGINAQFAHQHIVRC